jgi:hypothetical protein
MFPLILTHGFVEILMQGRKTMAVEVDAATSRTITTWVVEWETICVEAQEVEAWQGSTIWAVASPVAA